jgi:hypothetical protein
VKILRQLTHFFLEGHFGKKGFNALENGVVGVCVHWESPLRVMRKKLNSSGFLVGLG